MLAHFQKGNCKDKMLLLIFLEDTDKTVMHLCTMISSVILKIKDQLLVGWLGGWLYYPCPTRDQTLASILLKARNRSSVEAMKLCGWLKPHLGCYCHVPLVSGFPAPVQQVSLPCIFGFK